METPPSFAEYLSANDHTLFSAPFFNDLTFQEAAVISLPPVRHDGYIASWSYTQQAPLTRLATVILPAEMEDGVPSISDLAGILRGWEKAYSEEGARGVELVLTTGERQVLHLSKVWSFPSILHKPGYDAL
jgi:hypothetical protein